MSFQKDKNILIDLLKTDPVLNTLSGTDEEYEQAAERLIAKGVRCDAAREVLSSAVDIVDLARFEGKGFDELQLQEISLGIEHGLNIVDIDLYAQNQYNHYQMREMRVGLLNGLSFEVVSFYGKPEFSVEQMNVMRVGFELGMTVEEVSLFSNPNYTWQQMFRIRNQIREKTRSNQALNDTIKQAEAMRNSSGAPEHFKQEGFEL